VKPWESPYAGFANNPIYFVDPSGLDPAPPRNCRLSSGDRRDALESGYTRRDIRRAENSLRKQGGVIGVEKNDAGKYNIIGGTSRNVDGTYNDKVTFRSSGTSTANTNNSGKASTSLSAWDRFVNWLAWFDHNAEHGYDNPSGNKPVKTNFHGIQQLGGGATKNNHMTGLPDFSDDGYNPGSTISGMSYKPTFNPRKMDDWDDWLDDDGVDGAVGQLGIGVGAIIDFTGTFLDNGDAESVNKKAEDNATAPVVPKDKIIPNGNGMYTYYIWTENGYKVVEENVEGWQVHSRMEQNPNIIFTPITK
jgi:hypothetical protein